MLREREKKTLILIHCVYLQLRKYIYTRLGVLTTTHVTYIKKERLYTINSLYSTIIIIIIIICHLEKGNFNSEKSFQRIIIKRNFKSLFVILKKASSRLEKIQRDFLSKEGALERSHQVNWSTTCMGKRSGGLGIGSLSTLNKVLLGIWC